ncbi:DUF2568 domain-containing protein [Kitasatospora sp. NPDC004615]|uniref:DUF2568 domain-containing protein n=1 Tax=Kitasatospora sp. NPDC004615 TaxID=3364017 RepID=UPI0036CC1B1C
MAVPVNGIGPVDVLVFAAELAVYAAAARWAWTRAGRRALRAAGAVGSVALLAVLWGQFAAPTATHALHGPARVAFEICWFGTGALAAAGSWRRR